MAPTSNRWHFLGELPEDYQRIFPPRFQRRLVDSRRVPFAKSGRRIVLNLDDLDDYLASTREEPPRLRTVRGRGVAS